MNPGRGMAQTGAVRRREDGARLDGISLQVDSPKAASEAADPGFECGRMGQRDAVVGLGEERFGTADAFSSASRLNYCPLCFMMASAPT
jgi:hypothetical protein